MYHFTLALKFIQEKHLPHLEQKTALFFQGTGAPHPSQIALENHLEHLQIVSAQQSWSLEQFLQGKGGAGYSQVPQGLDELIPNGAGVAEARAQPAAPC